jgi:hypothetical protein
MWAQVWLAMRLITHVLGGTVLRDYLRRHLLLVALLGITAPLFAICAFRLSGIAADDSFIHRRIALNYQHLGKPYFNPDQRVMVTSSPLWTVLLAAAGAVLPVANAVPWLELIFVLMGATAAYLLAREGLASRGLRALSFPALAFLYVFVADFPSSMDQMETPCAVALMLAGTLGVLIRRNWGMPLLVLACFTRYECVPLCGLAGIYVSVRGQWTKSSLLSSTAIGLSGLAWLRWEYRTVIPNTVIAKSHLYVLTYGRVLESFFPSKARAAVLFVLGVVWLIYGRSRRRAQNPAAILLASFGVLLWVAYVVHKTFIFSWYLPLVLAPIAISILLCTDTKEFRGAALGAIFAGAILCNFVFADVRLLHAAWRGAPSDILAYPAAARVHEYYRIGTALFSECPSGTLMTSEIGGIGWGFRGKILDGAGLASPEAIRYHPMRIPEERSSGELGEIPAAFLRARRPDMIVSYDVFAESALPAARSLGYIDYSYPLFVREDRSYLMNSRIFGARQMHVLVAPDGHCSPTAVDQAVRMALNE